MQAIVHGIGNKESKKKIEQLLQFAELTYTLRKRSKQLCRTERSLLSVRTTVMKRSIQRREIAQLSKTLGNCPYQTIASEFTTFLVRYNSSDSSGIKLKLNQNSTHLQPNNFVIIQVFESAEVSNDFRNWALHNVICDKSRSS